MKQMKIRRPDNCVGCGVALAAGTEAFWNASTKSVSCLGCGAAAGGGEVSESEPTDELPAKGVRSSPAESTGAGVVPDTGVAGQSARREHERRSAKELARKEKVVADDAAWRQEIVEKKPVMGRIYRGLTPKPTIGPESQTTKAWKVGAEGEERVAEVLHGIDGVVPLHDRRVPGSRANIDHLAVGPAGVFVIDAKKYKEGSAVEVRDVGPLWRTDERLFYGGRDRTKLVTAMHGQIEVVRNALGDEFAEVPIHGVLCFIGATWGWRPKRKKVRGVIVVWPDGLKDLVKTPGPHQDSVENIAAFLRKALPAA